MKLHRTEIPDPLLAKLTALGWSELSSLLTARLEALVADSHLLAEEADLINGLFSNYSEQLSKLSSVTAISHLWTGKPVSTGVYVVRRTDCDGLHVMKTVSKQAGTGFFTTDYRGEQTRLSDIAERHPLEFLGPIQ